jgi:hypothetical protein
MHDALGCSANVLPYVESRCSGRRSCSGVLKDVNAMGICESFYRNYLEASYSCIQGKVIFFSVRQFFCYSFHFYKILSNIPRLLSMLRYTRLIASVAINDVQF